MNEQISSDYQNNFLSTFPESLYERSEFVYSRIIFNSSTIAWGTKFNRIFVLKLQSVNVSSLSPSMFEKLELQLFVQLCSLRGLCSGADESNVLR